MLPVSTLNQYTNIEINNESHSIFMNGTISKLEIISFNIDFTLCYFNKWRGMFTAKSNKREYKVLIFV